MKQVNLIVLLFILTAVCNNYCLAYHYMNGGTNDTKEIKLNPPKNPAGVMHAPALQLVTAYLQGNLLTVNFTSPAPNATIAISNKLTGEVEYTEVCNTQSTTIYLSVFADYGNTYTIDRFSIL